MEYRKLGHMDIDVSVITYGSFAIGDTMWGGTEKNEERFLSILNVRKITLMAFCVMISFAADAKHVVGTTAEAFGTRTVEPIVARLTRFEVKQEREQEFRKILTEAVSFAMTLEGNIMVEAYHEVDQPLVLWFLERWVGPEDLEKFSKSNQGRSLEAMRKEALIKPPKTYVLRDLESLTKQQWRAVPRREDKPLTVMLFVDARVGTQQQFKDTYHIAMPKFRGETGVVTYQLSEIEGDGTQFVTYEKFRNPDAFQYHLNFPPVKPVIEYLESNVKHPPFQNGLHNLVEIAPMTRE
ncbi:antibiotic biosynthesis monooxygenase [Dyadobacter sp. CY261]|uniref:putative quinol monooxygenase n=1 Tax=Dyadobacter sp. CY261 TaxID=2907203 RepID=UPI001F478EFB|nr:antibiotic biosynthesis monooxygenase [Dyadobacter sp. CY261]MCF0068831.1 antibiotic biosynthesis monooxygenase [Dyadobacter sp. CY261]